MKVDADHKEAVEIDIAARERIRHEMDADESRPVDMWTVMACVVCCWTKKS